MGQEGFLRRSSIGIKALTLLFAGFITWIIYQANMGFDNRILELARGMTHLDKVLHFALFGSFAYELSIALRKSMRLSGIRIMHGVLVVAIFCLIEECTQMGIATRSFDLIDLGCDLLGIGIANYLLVRRLG